MISLLFGGLQRGNCTGFIRNLILEKSIEMLK